jgi:hypothetical protein
LADQTKQALFVKTRNIGDSIILTASISALPKEYRYVDIVCFPESAPIFEMNKRVRNIFIIPRDKRGIKKIMAYISLFKKLFKEVYKDLKNIGGWAEDTYQYESESDFDKDSFNYYVDRQLSNMEEELEKIENLQSFTEMVTRINKQFKPNVAYNLPKLKGVTFVIKGFDKDDLKINVDLRHGLKKISRKVSEENFYNLINKVKHYKDLAVMPSTIDEFSGDFSKTENENHNIILGIVSRCNAILFTFL